MARGERFWEKALVAIDGGETQRAVAERFGVSVPPSRSAALCFRFSLLPGVECTTRTAEIPEPLLPTGTTAAGCPSPSFTHMRKSSWRKRSMSVTGVG
jgi:hypothetical protein